jgi:hypothetical protein
MPRLRREHITVRTHSSSTSAGAVIQVSMQEFQIYTLNHSCRFVVHAASSSRLCVTTAAYHDITADLSCASHLQHPCAACYHGTQTPCSERCASEQQLACMLHELNISSSMCAHVAVDWWHGRVDFLHAQHSMLIQADGSCHDTGAYDKSAEQVVKSDAGFCTAAYAKYLPTGGSVLRVRTCESDLHGSLLPGFKLAAAGRVIVLSPTYCNVMCDLDGSGLHSFPAAVVAALHGCVYDNEQGWHVIKWQQPVELHHTLT